MKNLNVEAWNQALADDQNAVLLDVRTPRECAEGTLTNAKALDFLNEDIFTYGLEGLEKEQTYYVYCRSGNRSLSACRIMEEKGFDVINLQGGLMAMNAMKSV